MESLAAVSQKMVRWAASTGIVAFATTHLEVEVDELRLLWVPGAVGVTVVDDLWTKSG